MQIEISFHINTELGGIFIQQWRVQFLHQNAKIPIRGSEESAGADIFAAVGTSIAPSTELHNQVVWINPVWPQFGKLINKIRNLMKEAAQLNLNITLMVFGPDTTQESNTPCNFDYMLKDFCTMESG
eukprot:TRINITY_DN54387_c0_g1_i1.p1 TRINITY_DN54387_c0_g1~~TRINITY_DN54387_c0_g1_i1.p1  ORF type:complete len:127 (-),score=14.35 TRINITY_DN54387_c0_g1_i1:126-506(-)